jgi:hypothetical protein
LNLLNKKTILLNSGTTVWALLLFSLPVLFLSFKNSSGQKDVNAPGSNAVTIIPVQDPAGFLWGLTDTASGKLVMDHKYEKIYDFIEGYAVIRLHEKFGLIDKNGKEILPPDHGLPESQLQCGYIAFESRYGQKIFIFDSAGKAEMPMVDGVTGFLLCRKRIVTMGSSQYGMLNFKGDTILPFNYSNMHLLPEGFCVASKPDQTGYYGLYGLYNLDGKQLLPHSFESVDGFYNGRALVRKNGKYGVIDETGKELFYTDYVRMNRYYNGFAIVYKSDQKGETKIGVIDRAGREIVPATYQWLEDVYGVSEGLAAMAKNFKYGFVDTTGKEVIPFKYHKVESFQDGIAKVWVSWRHVGYINRQGEEVIPASFEAMDQQNLRRYYNRFIIGLKDSVCHVFNYSGKEIAALRYDNISGFSGEDSDKEKSFLASRGNRYGILDSSFRVKVPLEYELLEYVFPNKIAARKNGKTGFIDSNGKVIVPFEYDWIEFYNDWGSYENGIVKVMVNEKCGLMNSYGKLIVPAAYDSINNYSNGLAAVYRNGKYGFINWKGKEAIPALYDAAKPFDGYTAEVTLQGETFLIDSSGNRVEEETE